MGRIVFREIVTLSFVFALSGNVWLIDITVMRSCDFTNTSQKIIDREVRCYAGEHLTRSSYVNAHSGVPAKPVELGMHINTKRLHGYMSLVRLLVWIEKKKPLVEFGRFIYQQ